MLVVLLIPAIAAAATLSARWTAQLLEANVEAQQRAGLLPPDEVLKGE
jgi:hypothetical protein